MVTEILAQDVPEQKQESVECLVLCRCRHLPFNGKILEECLYIVRGQGIWVFVPRETLEVPQPRRIGLKSLLRIVLCPDNSEQLRVDTLPSPGNIARDGSSCRHCGRAI